MKCANVQFGLEIMKHLTQVNSKLEQAESTQGNIVAHTVDACSNITDNETTAVITDIVFHARQVLTCNIMYVLPPVFCLYHLIDAVATQTGHVYMARSLGIDENL